ncbi:MAG: heme ABC exporter ATP-binding protein CcmA [Asticcacaulis sp.]|uniref:heme ABC exporter ATP-binding protein CcmA n=1 Tax=Asticcacaulis sp. TaxID=1872648 RepID=UPI0039E59BFF
MGLNLKVEGLTLKKGYNLLIHNLNFEIKPGEAISLTGENGVGKTTLLRTLAGFFMPHAGTISAHENDVQFEPEIWHGSMIHFLGHQDALSPSRTVAQELKFQANFLGGDVAGIEQLNLSPLLDLETRYLSAGQKRRLSFARLLMVKRPLWLLDEPMAPLDVGHRALLAGIIQKHLSEGGMIIAAVHDPLPFETRSLKLERPTAKEREAASV